MVRVLNRLILLVLVCLGALLLLTPPQGTC